MSEEVLNYYNRELAYLRQQGAEFAQKHPKIAGRLKMDKDNIEDPHVSRLLEGVAFLTARIRHKLDDSFPELTDSLLNTIYPDYQAPIPSTTVLQLLPKQNMEDLVAFKKETEIESYDSRQTGCKFKSCYDVNLWPITVDQAALVGSPFDAPDIHLPEPAKSIIKIDVSACDWMEGFNDVVPDDFDCYLSGAGQVPFKLYEMIFNNCLGIAISDPSDYMSAQPIDLAQLSSKGFASDEKVLPYSNRTAPGYRLLGEYFTCPEKFLFFKLSKLAKIWPKETSNVSIYFYLDCFDDEMQRQVSAQNFSYGSTPIINTFSASADPISLERHENEVQIHPFIGEIERAEVHSIESVRLANSDGEEFEVKPFYRTAHPANTDEKPYYWMLRREKLDDTGISALEGYQTYLSVVDASAEVQDFDQGWLLNVDMQCSNRNQAAALPFGPNEPRLDIVDKHQEMLATECKQPLTKPLRIALHDRNRWQLVSHLSLQHFSGEHGLQTLRSTLALYNFKNSPDNLNFIDGIAGIEFSSRSARIKVGGHRAIVMGTFVEIEFKGNHYSGNGVFLFSKVLENFFAQFAMINSFVQLSTKIKNQLGDFYTGKPMAGNKPLL